MSTSNAVSLFGPSNLFNLNDPQLQWAFIAALIGPVTWNILCRFQYYGNVISTIFGGSKRIGCYALAVYILAVGFYRDYTFHTALLNQPHIVEFASPTAQYIGMALIGVGQLFVLTSFYQLGFVGTFLGDYFGFLMDAPVTGFPFNVLSNPMYIGATMTFAGHALMQQSASGLLYTVWVYAIYRGALSLEEPFTNYIYSQRAKQQASNKKK